MEECFQRNEQFLSVVPDYSPRCDVTSELCRRSLESSMIPYRSFTTRDVKLCVSRSKCGTAGPHIIYWLLVVHGVVDKSSPVW
mmetsp:Transcript_14242/g.16007  ORF Transcript_14242/g.16007 Transcript_14242/m.16007 type:complete len:83 (+) Transcript_14242:853-1101(+)